MWLLQIDDVIVNIQYSFLIINCFFLIHRFLLKGLSNILKVFQIILATTTEVTELESLLLNNVVFLIMDRSSLWEGRELFFR